jgi:hypothetical protein
MQMKRVKYHVVGRSFGNSGDGAASWHDPCFHRHWGTHPQRAVLLASAEAYRHPQSPDSKGFIESVRPQHPGK